MNTGNISPRLNQILRMALLIITFSMAVYGFQQTSAPGLKNFSGGLVVASLVLMAFEASLFIKAQLADGTGKRLKPVRTRFVWFNLLTILAMILGFLQGALPSLPVETASAHNLQTEMVNMFFDKVTQNLLDARIAGGWVPGTPILKPNDEIGLIIKVMPRETTTTGVGGHVDFYIPNGVTVVDAAYMVPDGAGGYTEIAMKGQSPIAVGDGPIGAKSTSQLVGWNLTLGPSISGVTAQPVVPASGLHRGTIAGLYGDTGIFFSTDPDLSYGSWQRFTGDWLSGGNNHCGLNPPQTLPNGVTPPVPNGKTITNNSGDVFVPCNKWDAEQMYAWGVKGTTCTLPGCTTAPIVDYGDGRGNAPWGFASGVAGPQSGYAWHFDWDEWRVSAKTAIDMQNAMQQNGSETTQEIGPWQRLKYPGSRLSYDQPGTISTTIGYANIDGSNVGVYDLKTQDLPDTVNQEDSTSPKAIRWAIGQLTAFRPEYVYVKIRVNNVNRNPNGGFLDSNGCPIFHSDTFGGDAGGTDNGKDHLWRYYQPSEYTWNGCLAVGKQSNAQFVKVGDTFSYTIKVYNLGDTAQTNVVIKDLLPSGVTFISANPAQNSGPNPLIWNLPKLDTNQVFQSTLTVKATATGYLDNCLTVISDQGTQNTCETIPVNTPFLVPSKSVTPTSVAPGGTVTYTMLVKNIGKAASYTPVILTDYLPAGFTYQSLVSATVNGASVTPTVNATNPKQPVFTVATAINAGSELTLKFTALAGANIAPGDYCNTMSVTTNGVPITTGSEGCVTVGGGQIGDTIFRDWDGDGTQDAGEEGLPNVTVNLLYAGADGIFGTGDDSTKTATTDSNGNYLFTGLQAGNYRVTVPTPGSGGVPTGYTLTADPNGAPYTYSFDKTLADKEVYLGADWGYKPGGSGQIGDQVFSDANDNGVFDTGDVGIPGATVNLYEDTNGNGVIDSGDLLINSVPTDANGVYNFTGLATGLSYIVDVVDANITTYFGTNAWLATTADPQAVPNLAGTYLNADFGYYKVIPGAIGDEVFQDNNGNGVYDAGDQYLPLVKVSLYRDYDGDGQADPSELIGTTQTNANGHYLFDQLPPGNYITVVDTSDPDLPAGLAAMTSSYNINLGSGVSYLTADFPFAPLISKTVDKPYAAPGDTINFSVSVNFPGSDLLDNVTVQDPLPVGTNCGTVGQGGTCGAFAPKAGVPGVVSVDTTGMGIYSNSNNTPQYRLWDGSAFDVETASVNLGDTPNILIGASAPTRDEKIVLDIINNNPEIQGMLWNGTAWTALPIPPATGTAGALANLASNVRTRWGAAVAYEQLSGDAVVVWNNTTTAGTNRIAWNVWNGSAWGTTNNISTTLEPQQMRLAARPGSDQMVLVVSDASGYDYAYTWNGSAWSTAQTLQNASLGSQTSVFVAYEQQSGKAIVVYGKAVATDNKLYYRTWDGSSWSNEASIDPTSLGVTTGPQWVSLAADPTSNRLAVGVVTSGGRTWLAVWNGSAWGNLQLATATSLSTAALNVGVAFETQSGDLLAAYGSSTAPAARLRYRTFTGGSWSGETSGPDIVGSPNVIVLARSPNSDRIMLSTNDSNNDAKYTLWDGNTWGTPFLANANTGGTVNQPILFLYDQNLDPASSTTLVASPTTVAKGGSVTVTMTLKATKTVASVTPNPLVVHNGSATCVGPAETIPATVSAGVAKSFTFTCTADSLGEIWFSADATSAGGYAFAEGTTNSVLVSTDGSANVVTWNLGSNTPDKPGVVASGGNPATVYAFQGGTTAFWAYGTLANSWSAKAATPNNDKKGAGLTYLSPYVYGTRGDRQKTFYRCDVTTTGVAGACDTSWSTLTAAPANIGEGGAITNDGTNIYILRGDGQKTFWRYNVGAGNYTQLADTPANVKKGGALVYASPYIYAFQGDTKTGFWRYDIAGNTWTAMAPAPAAVGWGGSLTYVSPYIYGMEGNGKLLFWRYDIAANTWTARANTPGVVADGGALTNDGTYIYAFQGKTTAFWRYTPSTNTWTTLAPALGATNQGGALTYYPGTQSVSRKTVLTAYPTLVKNGGKFTIKMELTSATLVNNVSPSALSVSAVSGASAVCTGPTPASQNVPANTPTSFTWSCTATAGATPGSLTYSASATGDGPTDFASATANSVLVTPVLTFSATVTNPLNPPGLTVVNNTAVIDDSSDPAPQPPMCYAIADYITPPSNNNDILVGWNLNSNLIQDVGTGTGTVNAEAVTFNADYTKLYTTDLDPSQTGSSSDRLGTINVGTGLYTPLGRVVNNTNPLSGSLGNITSADIDGLSVDPQTGNIYAIGRREDGNLNNTLLDYMFVIDPVTNFHIDNFFGTGQDYIVLRTDLLPVALYDVDDIAFNPASGVLYAIANDSTTGVGDKDRLIKINKTSGVLTDVGPLLNTANGAAVVDVEGLTFQADGTLYATTGSPPPTNPNPNSLWKINPANGQTTLITAFPSHDDYEAIACTPGGAAQVPLPPTPSNTTQTALTATIGDFVWTDTDGDGVQDTGEPGLAGVKVYIDSNNNGVWDAGEPYDISDGFGAYRIFGLTPDVGGSTYVVRTDPATYPFQYVPSTTQVMNVNLSPGQQYNQADFGLQPPGTGETGNPVGIIGDTVWLDANNNGTQDGSETGISGITVRLYRDLNGNGILDASDPYVTTKTTDANGHYLFTNLPTVSGGNPVKYLVVVDESSQITTPYGDTTTLGTAMDPTTGTVNPKPVTLSQAAPTVLTADFGYNWSGSIGDYVWFDDNINGVPDIGEPNAGSGVVVLLYHDTNGNGILEGGEPQVGITFTDANGLYHFNNLPPGDYLVQVYEDSLPTPPAVLTKMASSTYDNYPVPLSAGQVVTYADFGFYAGSVVGDDVFYDENHNGVRDTGETGIAGVTVTLTGVDVGGHPVTQTAITDAEGKYHFHVAAGDYTITYTPFASPYPEATTPTSYDLHVVAGIDFLEADFGFDYSGKIGDRVWNDTDGLGSQTAGEPGLPNITLNLYLDADGNPATTGDQTWLAATSSDATGNYNFVGLPDTTGSQKYVVKVDPTTLPAGFTASGEGDPGTACGAGCDHQIATTLTGGATITNVDFGYAPPANTWPVSGRVWNDLDGNGSQNGGEQGIQYVTVCLYDSTGTTVVQCTTTDSLGNYTFSKIADGNYVIKVDPTTLPSNSFAQTGDPDGTKDNQTAITVAGAAVTGKDFGYKEYLGSISGTICDGSGNGLCDMGETTLAGVPVFLTYAGPDGFLGTADDVVYSTTTDGSGNYSFINLEWGDYQVTKINPLGKTNLADADGGDPNNISVTVGPGLDGIAGTADDKLNHPDRDFEVQPATGLVGDTVFLDVDGDGVQDVGEPGIPNAQVKLYRDDDGTPGPSAGDTLVGTQITDANGKYLFTDVPPGNYYVDVVDGSLPGGLTPSNGTPENTVFTLVSGQNKLDVDMGFTNADAAKAIIGDFVWSDDNGNGIQDPGEPGISGVGLTLKGPGSDGIFGTGDDTTVATTTTSADGHYYFTGVIPGSYIVDVTNPPAGYSLTSGPQANPDPTHAITVIAGQSFLDADFGYQKPTLHDISDTVWYDTNRDGALDTGEPGIPGVSVNLWTDPNGDGNPADGVIIATTTTDANGDFTFTGLPDGKYVVVINDTTGQLVDYQYTTPSAQTGQLPVTVAGADVSGTHFGYVGLGPIGDTVFSDHNGNGIQDAGEPGIGGVVVNLYYDNGDKIFNPATDTLIATRTTDASGSYLFNDLPAGTFFVSVDNQQANLTGYTKTTTDQEAANQPGTNSTEIDAVLTVTDVNMAVIDGALDVNGDSLITTADDGFANGVKVVDGLLDLNDDGVVNGSDDGWWNGVKVIDGGLDLNNDNFVTNTDDGTVVVSAPSFLNADFGYQKTSLADVSGTVWNDVNANGKQDPGEPGLGGVTVCLMDSTGQVQVACTTTDANGDYTFFDVPPGNYIVDVTDENSKLNDYTPTTGPDQRPVTVGTTDVTDVDFGYVRTPSTGSIGDYVWFDANHDGIQQASETGIPNVTLKLYNTGPDGLVGGGDDYLVDTTTTDTQGNYLFTGLPNSNYYVDVDQLTLPAGLTLSSGFSDPSPVINLSTGQAFLDADFGYHSADVGGNPTSAIGDLVWHDVDGDGAQDAGEPGIGGVTVTVIGPSCPSGCVVVTDPTGFWLVPGLAAGNYTVTVTPPAGYTATPTNGPASRVYVIPTGLDVLYADYGFTGGPIGTIGDTVYLDANRSGTQNAGEAGIPNVTVNLYSDSNNNGVLDTGEPLLATTTTDSNGNYEFSGLPDGNYVVTVTDNNNELAGLNPTGDPDQPGGLCTTCDNQANADVSGGVGPSTVDFGYGPAGGSIGNQVFRDLNGDGVFGTKVIDGKLDLNGDGLITLLDTGILSGLVNVPVINGGLLDLNGDNLIDGNDSGTLLGVPVINGALDMNNDAVIDSNDDGRFANEPGIQGVTIDVWFDANNDGTIDPGTDNLLRSTVTDANGNYEFKGLPTGQYIIDVTDKFGVLTGFTKTTGIPYADNNSQMDPYVVTLTSVTPSNYTADFGYFSQVPHNIAGTTFEDKNSDGIWQLLTEPIVRNVNVYLFRDLDGNGRRDPGEPLISTTVSDAFGNYLFTNLPDGKYVVVSDTRGSRVDGYFQTTQKTSFAVQPVTLAGLDSLGNDFGFVAYNPIPTNVQLASFTASAQEGSILLQWTTLLEIDVVKFNIYRSTDPKQLGVKIASVDSGLPGGGYDYQITDNYTVTGLTYYFLEIERTDGSVEVIAMTWVGGMRLFLPTVLHK